MQNINENEQASSDSDYIFFQEIDSVFYPTVSDSSEIMSITSENSTMQSMTIPKGNKIPPVESTSSPPVPALRRGTDPSRTTTTVNGKPSYQCIVTDQRSIDCHGDAITLSADTLSLASKTSRSSRFLRGVSFRRSRAATWLAAKLRKHQKSSDLSAAFNLLDQENKVCQL